MSYVAQTTDTEPAQDSGLLIRDATNNDVDAVNGLFMDEYGEGYPYLMDTLNHSHINLVAVVNGRIVGFARAAPYGRYLSVWELCSLMVAEDHRGRGIAREFTQIRLERLDKRNVTTVVSEGVTCYEDCASQRNLMKFGFKPYGLLPFRHPWIRPGILGIQPLTLTLQVLELKGLTGFSSRCLFLPDSYRLAAESLVNASLINPPERLPSAERAPRTSLIKGRMIRGIRGADYVDVPLNWQSAIDRIRELRLAGYGMAAFLPGFGLQGTEFYDVLRMHRPDEYMFIPDFDLIHVVEELVAHKAFVRRELTI